MLDAQDDVADEDTLPRLLGWGAELEEAAAGAEEADAEADADAVPDAGGSDVPALLDEATAAEEEAPGEPRDDVPTLDVDAPTPADDGRGPMVDDERPADTALLPPVSDDAVPDAGLLLDANEAADTAGREVALPDERADNPEEEGVECPPSATAGVTHRPSELHCRPAGQSPSAAHSFWCAEQPAATARETAAMVSRRMGTSTGRAHFNDRRGYRQRGRRRR